MNLEVMKISPIFTWAPHSLTSLIGEDQLSHPNKQKEQLWSCLRRK